MWNPPATPLACSSVTEGCMGYGFAEPMASYCTACRERLGQSYWVKCFTQGIHMSYEEQLRWITGDPSYTVPEQ